MHFRALVCLLFISISLYAQVDTALLSSKLEQSKDRLGRDVAVVLMKDGKLVYKKDLGKLTIKTQQPIGASSQWLTAALVMTYVQEGKISLDDKVGQYLPLFDKYYKGYITLRHCLTNYTGIRADGKLLQKSKYKSLEEEVNDYASKRDIQTNAGTEFRYSNIGYNIAGRVLEVITKKSFDRLMQERIVRPLAMKNTTFTNEDYNDAINPSTGARSSATDMANFMSMLLNKGTFNNKPVLKEESVATLLTLQVDVPDIKLPVKQVEGFSYGLGSWIVEKTDAGKPSAFSALSFTGTWPILDVCRGYALSIFTKDLSNEPARQIYFDIKSTIDEMIRPNCN